MKVSGVWKKVAIASIVGVILVAVAGVVAITWFLSDMCADTVTGVYVSPGENKVVTVYQRGCGATAAIATRVNIQKKFSGKFHPDRGATIATITNDEPVKVMWKGDTEVVLQYRLEDRFSGADRWEDVTVLQREVSSTP